MLITGGNSFIAKLLRMQLATFRVCLVARSPLKLADNETFLLSPDLQDCQAWEELSLSVRATQVFHLAEDMKGALRFEEIVESHVCFLSNQSRSAKFVVYPLTAYLCDPHWIDNGYVRIKKSVNGAVSDISNVWCPIIHPLLDGSGQLGSACRINNLIPFVNIFCAFRAKMPVTKSDYLKTVLAEPEKYMSSSHIYTRIAPISDIFDRPQRINIYWFSKLIFVLLKFFNTNKFHLLREGRNIDV